MRGAVVKTNQPNSTLDLFTYEKPTILVVGNEAVHKRLLDLQIEKRFNLSFIFTNQANVETLVNGRTVAIIIDEKSSISKSKGRVKQLLKDFKLVPVFYLSRQEKKPQFYQSLYENGLHGVINWPQESSVLYELIIESLKPKSNIQGKSEGEKRLAECIKAHIMMLGNYKSIEVKVIDGFVFLSGKIKTLFDKMEIQEEVSNILGVKKVIDKDLVVRKSRNVTDKEIERKIKLYMTGILDKSKRSVTVKVKDRIVKFMGVVEDKHELNLLERFAAKQNGVLGVVKNIKRKPGLVSKYAKQAKAIESRIRELFQGVRHVKVKIYGEYAEVTGTVKVKSTRGLIEKYILQALPVNKVVNKLIFV